MINNRFCEIGISYSLSFLLLYDFYLRKFLYVNFRYYNFGLFIKLEYVLLFFVLRGNRVKLQVLNLKFEDACVNVLNMRVFFIFGINVLLF